MKQLSLHTLFLASFATTLAAAAAGMTALAHAQPAAAGFSKVKPPAAVALKQSYTWNDGKTEHTVWLDPQLLAEFKTGKKTVAGSTQATPAAAPKTVNAKASAVGKPKGGAQLWHMGTGMSSDQVAQSLMAKSAGNAASGRYSPVFRDGSNASSKMRALPGNVIVRLNPLWGQAEVDAWAAKAQLEVVNKLAIGPNAYVIKTQPGLASLTTANALSQSSGVMSATPNWWTEMVAK